jgi:RNase P/RNase MRP subunit p30
MYLLLLVCRSLTTCSEALQSYDIVSATPTSFAAFTHLCNEGHVDIISIDIGARLQFHAARKFTDAALKRGVSFEVWLFCIVSHLGCSQSQFLQDWFIGSFAFKGFAAYSWLLGLHFQQASTPLYQLAAIRNCSTQSNTAETPMRRLPTTPLLHNCHYILLHCYTLTASSKVCYGPAVRTQSSRRLLISNTAPLLQSTHGKSLLLSGGLDSAVYARSPLDVANLGQLIGLTELAARNTVSRNATAVLLRAQARRAKFKGIELQLPEAGSASSRYSIADLTVPAHYYLPQARDVAGQKITAATATASSGSSSKQQKRSDGITATSTAAATAAAAADTGAATADDNQDDMHDDMHDDEHDTTAGTGFLALDELSDSDIEEETNIL